MNIEQRSRRHFLKDATAGAVLAGAAAKPAVSAGQATAEANSFISRWTNAPDRVWFGPEYWANPIQDWRLVAGRIECTNPAVNRNVHLLTRQLRAEPGDLSMSVRIGRVGGGKLSDGRGSAGFRIGVLGPLKEYRNSLIFGQGLDAGMTSDGKLFVGNPAGGVPLNAAVESIELHLTVEPRGEQCTVTLTAHDQSG